MTSSSPGPAIPTIPLIEVIFKIVPELLPQHDADDGFGQIEDAFEVGVENIVPIFFAHHREQLVARDAGIVDEDIDAAELFLDLLNKIFRLIEVRDVRLKSDDRVAIGDFVRQLLCFERK